MKNTTENTSETGETNNTPASTDSQGKAPDPGKQSDAKKAAKPAKADEANGQKADVSGAPSADGAAKKDPPAKAKAENPAEPAKEKASAKKKPDAAAKADNGKMKPEENVPQPQPAANIDQSADNGGTYFDIPMKQQRPVPVLGNLPVVGKYFTTTIGEKSFWQRRWKLILLLVPVLACIIYYGFIATGMYVSESRFAVRNQKSVSFNGIMGLLGSMGGSSGDDLFIILQYIQSPDMIFSLDKKLGIRKHFSQSDADFLSRLPADVTLDALVAYWKSVVSVGLDSSSGILTLQTKAFTSEMAHAINNEILKQAEELVNGMNNRALADSLDQTKNEVRLSELRLAKARQELSRFRNQNKEIDPSATATFRVTLVGQLEAELAKTRAELETTRRFMNEDTHQIQALKNKMSGIEEQIEFEKDRIASTKNPELIKTLEKFEELTMEHEFAQKVYLSAIASLEAARLKMENKTSYIEAFQKPTIPDEPTYPERLRGGGGGGGLLWSPLSSFCFSMESFCC